MEGQQEQKPDASARRRTKSKNRTTRADPVNKPSPVSKQRRKTRKTSPNDKTTQLSTRLKRKNNTGKRQTPPKRKKAVREKEDGKKDNKDISQRAPNYPQPWGSSQKYVGAHLSIQGGIWKAVLEAKRIGARAFGLFLRSQRSWSCKPLDKEGAEKFQRACQEYGFESHFILPHSPYLMNLGSPKSDVFLKSRAMLVEELVRCQQLGLTMYNIHPGSCVGGISVTECVKRIADGINYAHSEVPGITVVLENMSCQGSTIGGRFEELRDIIGHVTDKSRIGVCLDTCHAFAAGHNLAEKYGLKHMLNDFSRIVGLDYLKAVHLNDSKGEVGCRLDRHENIGRGHIGLEGFRQIMNEPRFDGIPMILETPYRLLPGGHHWHLMYCRGCFMVNQKLPDVEKEAGHSPQSPEGLFSYGQCRGGGLVSLPVEHAQICSGTRYEYCTSLKGYTHWTDFTDFSQCKCHDGARSLDLACYALIMKTIPRR